jgi:hypothetical protein
MRGGIENPSAAAVTRIGSVTLLEEKAKALSPLDYAMARNNAG